VIHDIDKLPAWGLVLAYAVFWMLLGILVRSLLRGWLARIAKTHPTEVNEVVAATVPRPVGITVFLFGVSAGLRFLPLETKAETLIHHLLPTTLLMVGVVALMRVAFHSIDAYGRSNPNLQSSAGVARALTWVVGLGACAILVSEALGISLAPVLTALGVGSLAVALALQDTLANFFAGLYLVADKRVRPGDFIRMDPTYEGYVDSIGWRSTQLRTMANNMVIVPNSTLSRAVVTNYSRPTTQVASSVRFDVAPGSDIDKVEDLLSDEAKRSTDIPGMSPSPPPVVQFAPGFVDGVLGFTIYFQVATFTAQGGVQHALRKRVHRRLMAEKIELANPTAVLLKRA
jgi:small-conductance mechanosensitive channel